jgi:hypothetical protein
VYRPLQFQKCGQLLIGTHDETLSVAVSVHNPDGSPSESMAETQPKLHPALWTLSAMISQFVPERL